jgi:hypothetical protein
LLPDYLAKRFKVPVRPQHAPKVIAAKPLPPLNGSVPPLAMRPCSFAELDAARCRWPLGRIDVIATAFCGGTAAPGCPYCPHHSRLAHGHRPPS